MTMNPYYSVQIGPKLDPFCFQAIPGNSSAGELCYQRQTGSQVYEMGQYNTLRFDVDLTTGAGNVTSAVLANGENLWIVNHLPWYALGVKQCICTQPREGGDASAAPVYPLQFNWTDNMGYIGRENIGIEYGVWGNMTLDHWSYGPHHVWVVPETGSIIRMWQPYNGLQIFPNGTLPSDVDPALFNVPPPECTSAYHFTFKIHCNASGYPVPKEEAVAQDKADSMMWRAHEKVPRAPYKGTSFGHMSSVLNKWITHKANATKPCDQFEVAELQKLQAVLYFLRLPAYDDVYQASSDTRALRAPLEELQNDWEQLNKAAAQDEELELMHRDGHCHEAVMWWTHHLTEDAKKLLNAQGVVLPLLSPARHTSCPAASDRADHKAVCDAYDARVTCADCHANVSP